MDIFASVKARVGVREAAERYFNAEAAVCDTAFCKIQGPRHS